MKPYIPLGTKTRYGTIEAMGFKDGERWYMAHRGNPPTTTLMTEDDALAACLRSKPKSARRTK